MPGTHSISSGSCFRKVIVKEKAMQDAVKVQAIKTAVQALSSTIGPDLAALVRLNSENPPGREGAVARYVGDRLEALGAQVEYQMVKPGRPNVVGVLDLGPGPRLLLNAHTDTVPVGVERERKLLEPVIEDGRLYGRGACDDKGGLLAMLLACTAAAELKRQGHEISGTLILAGVMGEEAGGEGTRHLVDHGPLGDYAVVGEPTKLQPVLGHKGSYRKRLTINGRAAHSSEPHLGQNAIYGASLVALEIDALNQRLQKVDDPLFGSPAASANVIQGGSNVIVIAATCQLDIERRLLPGETEDTAQSEVDDILETVRGRYPDLTTDITDLGAGKAPSLIAADSLLAQSLKESVERVTGRESTFSGYTGGTDMTYLMAADVPTIIFGPGDLAHAHTAEEFIPLIEIQQAAEVYLDLFCRLGD
jgi:acetylornithine deacetylase/succinyl-diaminopimelate desuccinylase family protein